MPYKASVRVSGVWQDLTIDYSEVIGGPTALSDLTEDANSRHLTDAMIATYGGAGGGGLSIVWAEENAAFNTATNGGFQFAYGNGATSTNGITIAFDCAVIAMTLTSSSAATGTVELYKNDVATGKTVSLTAQTKNNVAITGLSITEGDNISFKTIAGSNGGAIVVAAVLATAGVTGADGAKGDTGPAGVIWKDAWVSLTSYDVNDLVSSGGSTYIANTDTSGSVIPSSSSDWDLFVSKGTDGDGAITKADVEAVLTGEISTHTHAGGSAKSWGGFFLTTGGATGLGSTAATLILNNTITGTDSGVFTLATNEVTVDKTAKFLIMADVYLNNSSTSRVEYSIWLEVNDVEVTGSRTGIYQRGYDSGSSGAVTMPVALTTGDTVRVRTQLTDGSTTSGYQDDNGTRLTLLEL